MSKEAIFSITLAVYGILRVVEFVFRGDFINLISTVVMLVGVLVLFLRDRNTQKLLLLNTLMVLLSLFITLSIYPNLSSRVLLLLEGCFLYILSSYILDKRLSFIPLFSLHLLVISILARCSDVIITLLTLYHPTYAIFGRITNLVAFVLDNEVIVSYVCLSNAYVFAFKEKSKATYTIRIPL